MAAMAAILDFRSAQFWLFFIYKSPRCFLASLESIGLSVQEKKRKIDFQDGGHGGHLGFPIGMILAIFDLQDASYQVSSQLTQGCRRRRLLKQLLMSHDERRTLTDHNSSP